MKNHTIFRRSNNWILHKIGISHILEILRLLLKFQILSLREAVGFNYHSKMTISSFKIRHLRQLSQQKKSQFQLFTYKFDQARFRHSNNWNQHEVANSQCFWNTATFTKISIFDPKETEGFNYHSKMTIWSFKIRHLRQLNQQNKSKFHFFTTKYGHTRLTLFHMGGGQNCPPTWFLLNSRRTGIFETPFFCNFS